MKNKNYSSNLSKRCFLVTFMLMFFVFGCNQDEILVEKPLDFLTSSNGYSTQSGIDQGIIGMYSDVRNRWFRNGGAQSYGLYGMGTDVGYDGEAPGSQRFLTNYVTSVNSEYYVVGRWWLYLYKHIQEANIIISEIDDPESPIEWSSDAVKNSYLAEARFFRGWSYWIAVTLWGDIPLITDVIDEAKVDFVRTPKDQVYIQIESDLIFASGNLPVRGSEPAPGKLTQGAALHLLTQVYLAQSKFQLAVDAASQVINNYGYKIMTERFGAQNDVFGSGDVYYDLFRYENQNAPDNTETIWAIQFEPLVEIGGSSNYWSGIYGPRYFSMKKTPDNFNAYQGYQDTLGRPVARCRGTNLVFYDVWQSDWDNDIRNAEHNIKRRFYFDSPQSQYHGQLIDWSLYPEGARNPLKDTTNYIFPYFMKTFEPVVEATVSNEAQGGGGSVHTDFYAMRVAETYLLRAEAYLGLGGNDAAAADINVVRNRSLATPVLPGDVDMDYILDERIRELYAEEMRMITLLRTNMLVERTQKYNDNPLLPGANIQSHNNLWPIPQSQIDLNLDAELSQNPGYQ